jgi:hypothetical protein
MFQSRLSVDTWTTVGGPSLSVRLSRNRAPEGAMAASLRELSRRRKATGFDTTRSRPRGDPTLLTCDGENESQKAEGDSGGWTNFNSSGGSFRRHSDSKVCFDDGGEGGGSSSK